MKIDVAPRSAQPRDRGGGVGLDAFRRRLLDVRQVLEVVAALLDAGGAAEVVDRHGRVAALGEAQRELLVEAVEAADVRQDDDARARQLVGQRRERGEAAPSRRLEHEILVRDAPPPERPGSAAASRVSKHMAARAYASAFSAAAFNPSE